MLWKESYAIGVDLIDFQHKTLFGMVEELTKLTNQSNADKLKDEYKTSIQFLKDYVVEHFAAEEDYQASINYKGIVEHKKIHRAFTSDVVDYEQKLIDSDFNVEVVKPFVKMLTDWLVNHVAGEDQKIVM